MPTIIQVRIGLKLSWLEATLGNPTSMSRGGEHPFTCRGIGHIWLKQLPTNDGYIKTSYNGPFRLSKCKELERCAHYSLQCRLCGLPLFGRLILSKFSSSFRGKSDDAHFLGAHRGVALYFKA
jgi:hypothetical protein